ncbi:hypothetical protein PINS_up006441 [Pythium insidiosum]|nr:hypothetical protein PINS_up006441 [Pythium insidiosum]
MAPTPSSLIASWRELRRSEKVGLYAYRSQSEIVLPRQSVPLGHLEGPPLRRLEGLNATTRMDVVLELSASERDDDDDGEDSVDTIAVTNQHEDKHEHDDTAFAEEASRMEERERDGDDRQNREDAVADLKIFVATWNMAAKDPFSASKGEYIGDDDAASKLSGLLPPGYDLYVLGTQEKVSKHLHQAVLARLHAAERTSGRRFVCLQRPDTTRKRARRWSRKPTTRSSEDDDDNNNGSALTRSSRAPSDASNNSSHHNSLSGYLHSFALEASSSIPVLSSKSEDDGSPAAPTPAKSSSRPRHSLFASRSAAKEAPFATEVSGRGDGAFLSSKSTSLSLYCASDLVEVVEIVRSGTHKFSFASGSKGGVAVMLRVAGHSLTFMNCHLDANRPSVRRQQLSDLSANLVTAMGVGVDASRPITTASDHVIWMGDFNYRIHTLDGASVLKQIAMGRHLEVHDRYDSMRDDLAMLPDLNLFRSRPSGRRSSRRTRRSQDDRLTSSPTERRTLRGRRACIASRSESRSTRAAS